MERNLDKPKDNLPSPQRNRLDDEIGWHNAEKLRELASKKDMHGVRVVYSATDDSDHFEKHNEHWDSGIKEGCLEAGTITELSITDQITSFVTVKWDCGVQKCYPNGLWGALRVYNLGPAGYLGQMVFCDKCLEPSKGLAFRLARENKSVGDLYDLCHMCYNQCDDEHGGSSFYCNIPSGNIDLEDSKKSVLPPRQQTNKYEVAGIFKHAIVEIDSSTDTGQTTTHGGVLNIVHEKGNYDLRRAQYYNSCAEVRLDTVEPSGLIYKEAGSAGKVELKAIKPGKAPSPMPVEHYPVLGLEIIHEMLTYKKKLVPINNGAHECFMRFKENGKCYSLTISGTQLRSIDDPEIWKRCEDLKIVILLMNELESLPEELCRFASTIELICIQHNNFTLVPPIVHTKLQNIKHLNLHGNQITKFPPELKHLKQLERLKFGKNKLYSLPDIFNHFQHLIEITFNDNYLTRLPPSFAELTKLESLDLTDNSFTSIPYQLLELPNLKVLHMGWNRIQRLAPIDDQEGAITLKLLTGLKYLQLKGNPVYEKLQSDKRESGLLKLVTDKDTFSDLHKAPVLKALRVLVLGKCGAGKTSIVEALSFNKYVTPTSEAHHDHTVGINRYCIPVQMKTADDEDLVIELRLWDFAGERSYIMMNNLFLTEGTLVWIAVNFQTYTCTDESFHEHVESWIQQVMTKNVRPVVWVIGTHTDKCTREEAESKKDHIKMKIGDKCEVFKHKMKSELERLQQMNKNGKFGNRSPACVRRKTGELEALKNMNVPCFVQQNLKVIDLTNTHLFTGFSNLRICIESTIQIETFHQYAKPLTQNEQIAADMLRQRTEEILACGEVPILSNPKVLGVFNQVLDAKQAESLLKYLYQCGEILFCAIEDEVHVILDVDWLIGTLKLIFHHDFEDMINKKKDTSAFLSFSAEILKQAVNLQQSKGIIGQNLLEALWHPMEIETVTRLTELLETIGLAYKITHSHHNDHFLFPWLVTKEYSVQMPRAGTGQACILISYDFSPCLPPCFIQELAVRCQKYKEITVGKVYKNAFHLSTTVHSSNVSVSLWTSLEENSICGKIFLCTTAQGGEPIGSKLWYAPMLVIRQMESLLSSWTFYTNLERKVYCHRCYKGSWTLEIKDYNKDKALSSIIQRAFMCIICNTYALHELASPPSNLLLKTYEYVDTSHARSMFETALLPDRLPYTQDMHSLLSTSEEHSTSSESSSSFSARDSATMFSDPIPAACTHNPVLGGNLTPEDVPQTQVQLESQPPQSHSEPQTLPHSQATPVSQLLPASSKDPLTPTDPPRADDPIIGSHVQQSQSTTHSQLQPTSQASHSPQQLSQEPSPTSTSPLATEVNKKAEPADGVKAVSVAFQISSARSLIMSGDVNKLCTNHEDMIDVECVLDDDCKTKTNFMTEASKFVCAILNSRNDCHLGVLLGGVSYNADKSLYEVVGISMSEQELSLVKDKLIQELGDSLMCASTDEKIVGVDNLVQFECLSVETAEGAKRVAVVYVTPKWELCQGKVYKHCYLIRSNSGSKCYRRFEETTGIVKPHHVPELESKLKRKWEGYGRN